MQYAVVVCLAIAAFGIGAIDGSFFGFEGHPIGQPLSPLSLDLKDEGLSNKIVGGYKAARNAFPFVAYVRYDGEIYCTGSLVNPRWVLTVGCSLPLNGTEVVLGQYDRKEVDESVQIFTISEVVILNDTLRNAAMFKLSSRANIRGLAVGIVQPVSSRAFMNRALRNGLECVQLGWGYQRRDTKFVTARFLRATGVNFVNDTEVVRRGYGRFLLTGHIGTEAKYTNECEFDSMCYSDNGGPVVCRRNKRNDWILTAVYAYFSTWDGCMTGVKATKNVLEMNDWIQSTISG